MTGSIETSSNVALDLLGTIVHFVPRHLAAEAIIRRSLARRPEYICACNVHMLMAAQSDVNLRAALESAALVLPDGMPLVWLARSAGQPSVERIAGPDLFGELCERSSQSGLKVGLLGGVAEAKGQLVAAIQARWPRIDLVLAESPWYSPKAPLEDVETCERIRAAGVELLLVGFGCPKQEIWMHHNLKHLECVAVGLGAAFDFVSGRRARAPRVMQQYGLEWLHRLYTEPKRLGYRYVTTNCRFVRALVSAGFSDRSAVRILDAQHIPSWVEQGTAR